MDDDEWPPPGHSILPENVSRTLALDSGADAETALTIVRAWLDSGGELEAIEDNGDTALIKASYANRVEVSLTVRQSVIRTRRFASVRRAIFFNVRYQHRSSSYSSHAALMFMQNP